MPKFKISFEEVYKVTHIVEAEDREEALDKALNDDETEISSEYQYTKDGNEVVEEIE